MFRSGGTASQAEGAARAKACLGTCLVGLGSRAEAGGGGLEWMGEREKIRSEGSRGQILWASWDVVRTRASALK